MKTMVRWVDAEGRELRKALFDADWVTDYMLSPGSEFSMTEPATGHMPKGPKVSFLVLSIEKITVEKEEANLVTFQKKPTVQ